jgi:protein TonB
MRKYTFLISLVAHAGVVAAVLVTTLVVTHSLPGAPPMFEFVLVRAEMPSPPPIPAAPRPAAPAPVPRAEIPIEAPQAVQPEADVPRMVDDSPAAGLDGVAGVAGPADAGTIGDAVGPPPPPEPKPVVPRVGGAIVPPAKVRHVAPVYPSIALAARVQGVVILDAVIGEDGTVRELRILRSVPLLDQAALEAVRQWRFTPTLLNGQPTPVIMSVTVSFALN